MENISSESQKQQFEKPRIFVIELEEEGVIAESPAIVPDSNTNIVPSFLETDEWENKFN